MLPSSILARKRRDPIHHGEVIEIEEVPQCACKKDSPCVQDPTGSHRQEKRDERKNGIPEEHEVFGLLKVDLGIPPRRSN